MNEQGEAQIGPCTATLPRSIIVIVSPIRATCLAHLIAVDELYTLLAHLLDIHKVLKFFVVLFSPSRQMAET
jgi:hypothetical protein